MPRTVVGSIAVLVLLTSGGDLLRAQVQRGVIRGTVSDSGRQPVTGAQVHIKNTDIRGVTDTAGRFVLPGVWPGTVTVNVQRIGLELQRSEVVVKAADTTVADFVMSQIAQLDPVETEASRASGRMAAFEQRRLRAAGGAFITRADIDQRNPSSLSEMLRTVSGVSVRSSAIAGEQPVVRMGRSPRPAVKGVCEVQLFVDGQPYHRGNVDDFPPETVEGIEIYRGGAEIPAEFRRDNAGCGLIAIWTRDPSAMRRRP
jgi:hypothetical protein